MVVSEITAAVAEELRAYLRACFGSQATGNGFGGSCLEGSRARSSGVRTGFVFSWLPAAGVASGLPLAAAETVLLADAGGAEGPEGAARQPH